MPQKRKFKSRPASVEELTNMIGRISLQSDNSVVVVRVKIGRSAATTSLSVRAEGKSGESKAYAKTSRNNASALQRPFEILEEFSADWVYNEFLSEETKRCYDYILAVAKEVCPIAIPNRLPKKAKENLLCSEIKRKLNEQHPGNEIYTQSSSCYLDKAPLALVVPVEAARKSSEESGAAAAAAYTSPKKRRVGVTSSTTGSEIKKMMVIEELVGVNIEIVPDPLPHFHLYLRDNHPVGKQNVENQLVVQLTTRFRATDARNDSDVAIGQTRRMPDSPSTFRRKIRPRIKLPLTPHKLHTIFEQLHF